MAASLGADDTGFRQQLVELLPSLRRFARSLAGSVADADDLVQTACERALTSAHQWQPGSRLDSWMYRIIQNLFTDGKRAAVVRGAGHDSVDPDILHGGDAREEVEASLLLESVRQAVDKLPAEQRKVLMLVCIEGLSYRQTAAALDLPIGTVMSRLCRARLALNGHLDGVERQVQ